MLRMPEHGDFPRVIVDMEPFNWWLESRRPKGVAWIIPARDPPKQTGSPGSPAPHEVSDGSDRDSSRNSPASSWASSPAHSVGSAVDELAVSSSSRGDSGSDTPSLSGDPSDDDDGQTSNNEQAGASGREEERSDNEENPGSGLDCQPNDRGDASNWESEDGSSDSYDESSDDGGGSSEAAQHLEEVYRWILQALHKMANIMCIGYVKAASEIQPIVHVAVQEAVQPNKTYIQSTTGHLSEWGQTLHDMLNSSGASAEEWKAFSRAARLAGLKCVRSLLADGQAFNAVEEQDIEKRLHDMVQATLKVANNRAPQDPREGQQTCPEDHPEVCARWSGGDLLSFGAPEHGRSLLVSAQNGDVPSGGALPHCLGNILHQRQHVLGNQQRSTQPLCGGHQLPSSSPGVTGCQQSRRAYTDPASQRVT